MRWVRDVLGTKTRQKQVPQAVGLGCWVVCDWVMRNFVCQISIVILFLPLESNMKLSGGFKYVHVHHFSPRKLGEDEPILTICFDRVVQPTNKWSILQVIWEHDMFHPREVWWNFCRFFSGWPQPAAMRCFFALRLGGNFGKIPLKTNGWNPKSSLNYFISLSFQKSFEPKTCHFLRFYVRFLGEVRKTLLALIDQFDPCMWEWHVTFKDMNSDHLEREPSGSYPSLGLCMPVRKCQNNRWGEGVE